MHRRAHTLISGIAILLIASCSGGHSGEPNPTTTTTSTESESADTDNSSPTHGAPSVPSPLDVRDIIDDPCSALTKQQTDSFPGTLDSTETAKTTLLSEKETSCNWNFQGDRYSYGGFIAGVALPRDTFHGVSSIYEADEKDEYEVFEPVKVAGYPAVINNETDNADSGDCRLSVGLRNDTAYRITADPSSESPDYDQPCEQAKKLAEFVVENLKEAQ